MSSKVYFAKLNDGATPVEMGEATRKVMRSAYVNSMIDAGEYVAIKFHVGEKKNRTHVPPEVIAEVVKEVKEKQALPFLTETSTLYRGERDNAVRHIMHAINHGFTTEKVGAPWIMSDGLAGDSEIEVPIDGIIHQSVMVAREARMADVLLVVSHMTGHIGAGYGAAIKNLGMGLSSRKGKMRQHSAMSPEIVPEKCVLCKKCIQWCPEDAISEIEGSAYIDKRFCIGCGECLAVCRFGAVKFDFSRESTLMQKSMAEHALGVVKGKKCFYINVLTNMTTDCDCFGVDQKKTIPDIGILASEDPVAIDQASLDLTKEINGKNLNQISYPNIDGDVQLEHAEIVKLGSRVYQLIEI